MTSAPASRHLEAYRAALHGEFGQLASILDDRRDEADPQSVAPRALLISMTESLGRVHEPGYLEALDGALATMGTEERHVALLAYANAHRTAMLTWNHPAARRIKGLVRTLRESASEASLLRADMVRVRGLVMHGSADASVHAKAVAARAAKLDDAAAVLEASTLRALATLESGDLSEGLRLARRASLMARTEGLLEQEYLANLVLARARRYVGQLALAARILAALAAVCPVAWRGWVGWELALCGELTHARRVATQGIGAVSTTANALVTALDAAAGGDATTCKRLLISLAEAAGPWPLHLHTAKAFIAALDPTTPISAGAESHRPWLEGDEAAPPLALIGLATISADPAARDSTGASIIASTRGESRRLLRAGAGLIEGHRTIGTADGGRPEALVAHLALAGEEGLAVESLFQRVFGAELVPVKHDGVFRTTLYRARGMLDDAGEIERTDDRLVLRLKAPILVFDPSTTVHPSERVLRALAARGGRASAKELAGDIDASLRATQDALQLLVDGGACSRVKSGRSVHYILEDTTFSEPTLTRLRPV